MNYFQDLFTVERIKGRYRKLAFEFHPDRGGTTAEMQDLNRQYHEALKRCHGKTSRGSDGEDHTYHYNQDIEQGVMDKLAELITLGLPNIRIMLVGTWVWLDGETRAVKDQLKALGFRWHSNREKWYWHQGKYRSGQSRGDFSSLAAKYGYREFEANKKEKLGKTA